MTRTCCCAAGMASARTAPGPALLSQFRRFARAGECVEQGDADPGRVRRARNVSMPTLLVRETWRMLRRR